MTAISPKQFSESLVKIILNSREKESNAKTTTDVVTTRMPTAMIDTLNAAAEATGESRADLILSCIQESLGVVVSRIFERREKAREEWEKTRRELGEPEVEPATPKKMKPARQ